MNVKKIPMFGSKKFEELFEEVVGDALNEKFPEGTVLVVLLAARWNPEYGQDPSKPPFGCPADVKVRILTFAEASRTVRNFIDENHLGASQFAGGGIWTMFPDHGEYVGHVSYNGRVWKDKGFSLKA